MKVKLPNSDVVCPQCHVHLEVEGSDLKFDEYKFATGRFWFNVSDIQRELNASTYLQGDKNMYNKAFSELSDISPLAKEAGIFTIYGGGDGDSRVYVVCPVCKNDITIIDTSTNALNLTVGGYKEELEGGDYAHATKTYGEFTVNLEYGRQHTKLTKKLEGYGYKIQYRL